MLTVHHLGHSQSERIVWLCEELGIDYELVRYDRRSDDRMAPPEYKALHPLGTAPVITDGDLVLGESGAICDYLIYRCDGRLARPGDADYLYWFHVANGSLQPLLLRILSIERLDPSGESPVARAARTRLDLLLSIMNARLSRVPFLAGDQLTAADIMTMFSLTTMRLFISYDLPPHVAAYVERLRARPAYRRATEKMERAML